VGDRLQGKVAIVTGGARGQGEAEARAFVAEGAKVLITDVLDAEGEALAKELGDAAAYRHLDVVDETHWDAAVNETRERFGTLDVLVNNAGILDAGPLLSTTLDAYRRVIDINQVGVFLGMRAAGAVMAEQGRGSIVNISSVDGMVGMAGMVAYVASKWAVRGMTKTAAAELGPSGVRVNSVHPGGVDTPMIQGLGLPEDSMAMGVPLGRVAQPGDIAPLVVFLASDESGYCTGAEFVIDGGMICALPVPLH